MAEHSGGSCPRVTRVSIKPILLPAARTSEESLFFFAVVFCCGVFVEGHQVGACVSSSVPSRSPSISCDAMGSCSGLWLGIATVCAVGPLGLAVGVGALPCVLGASCWFVLPSPAPVGAWVLAAVPFEVPGFVSQVCGLPARRGKCISAGDTQGRWPVPDQNGSCRWSGPCFCDSIAVLGLSSAPPYCTPSCLWVLSKGMGCLVDGVGRNSSPSTAVRWTVHHRPWFWRVVCSTDLRLVVGA